MDITPDVRESIGELINCNPQGTLTLRRRTTVELLAIACDDAFHSIITLNSSTNQLYLL